MGKKTYTMTRVLIYESEDLDWLLTSIQGAEIKNKKSIGSLGTIESRWTDLEVKDTDEQLNLKQKFYEAIRVLRQTGYMSKSQANTLIEKYNAAMRVTKGID